MTDEKTDVTIIPPKPKGLKRQRIRRWIFRAAWASVILAPLIFIFAAIGYKLGVIDLRFAFGTLNQKLGPLVLLVALVMGVISLVMALAIQPRKGFGVSVLALLIGLGGLVKLVGVKKTAERLPFIHDITTDTQDIPVFSEAMLERRAQTPGVNTVDYSGKKAPTSQKTPDGKPVMALVSALQTQTDDYADIRPLILTDTPDVVFGAAKAAARQLSWDISLEDRAAGLIEATDTSFWYGFKDDIIIRIRPSEGGGSLVDIRSISRVGGSDLGANAARIRTFLGLLKPS